MLTVDSLVFIFIAVCFIISIGCAIVQYFVKRKIQKQLCEIELQHETEIES